MAHTYEELSKMTAIQLRVIADGIEDERLKGHSTMHKEQLLPPSASRWGLRFHTTTSSVSTRHRSK